MIRSDSTPIKRTGLHWAPTITKCTQRYAGSCHYPYTTFVFICSQITWPSAGRAWELLHGVKVQVDGNVNPMLPAPDRQKRGAEDAFGREKSSDFLQREAFRDSGSKERMPSATGIQDISTRMMAHMLGLDVPGIEPPTPYYPGYEWWPRATDVVHGPYQQPPPRTDATSPEVYVHANYPSVRMDPGWRVAPPSYSYGFEGSLNQYQM